METLDLSVRVNRARKYGRLDGERNGKLNCWPEMLAETLRVNARTHEDWLDAEADAYVEGYAVAMLRRLRELGK